MRLDKFLKVSRLIKRRTLAKEICDQGRISINDHVAKASSTVKVGDILAVQFGSKLVKVRVNILKDSPRKEEADTLYTVLEETPVNSDLKEDDSLWG